MRTTTFNASAIDRAKADLVPFQSNLMVQTADGSEIHAVWAVGDFVDFELGDPIEDVIDFWPDERFPFGGFMPGWTP
ncbi:hypothetical protein [Rhodopila sp.]|uniref:hypothetical protein n=1 Tax=Rhodopila sp. TaxID=2480087 RepID=UPI003D126294